MKKNTALFCMLALAAMGFSCSETLQRKYDRRHGITSDSDDYRSDSDRYDRRTPTSTSVYRKDYDRIADENSRGVGSTGSGDADYNRRLVDQYTDMDKTGELVLYELDALESRWNVLLSEYRTARSSGKEVIATELDKISADQILLYKAYTNIYRNGKNNWAAVKREVENTLRSVRRATER
ncbi:hypothetical protein [Dyadobacter bucti]|uniref:hypothetical protein n=1 Tax=Dyadobacter bucti TaxID=2572203 RepID=UPI001E4E8FCF|nr:hypothetical protein [Dyadobacter bucti]